MKKIYFFMLLCGFSFSALAKAHIDKDILLNLKHALSLNQQEANYLSVIIFLHSSEDKASFLEDIKTLPQLTIQDLGFMPAVAITLPADKGLLTKLANHQSAMQISANHASSEELEVTAQAIKLTPSKFYPDVKNWWSAGFTGEKSVLGIIDSGIDPTHLDLSNKKLIVRTEKGSHYEDKLNGVLTAHGTGVACIYSGNNEKYKGMAYGVRHIVLGYSGVKVANVESLMLTLSSVDWMLSRAEMTPTLINYSVGNGSLSCPNCPEWSGLAKIVDYVVNQKKILWVKSAGNAGYIPPTDHPPFASTLTVPGDNYNALTVANMDIGVIQDGGLLKSANREWHAIHDSSSRGPTPLGRRKPDITAPGHNTRTCAPDPNIYQLNYTKSMDYQNGYRLMGGTSSAAPHVGAAALLLNDAGIKNPMAIKALLINSADTWTDSGSAKSNLSTHFAIMGSQWNRTYGWGYLNMQKAYEQRMNIKEGELTLSHPMIEYQTDMDINDKVTLVHERRVGYFSDGREWQLSHLSLEIIDRDTQQLIAKDDSAIDTVHQVANCHRLENAKVCSETSKPIHALIRVKLLSTTLDGSVGEPFALVSSTK